MVRVAGLVRVGAFDGKARSGRRQEPAAVSAISFCRRACAPPRRSFGKSTSSFLTRTRRSKPGSGSSRGHASGSDSWHGIRRSPDSPGRACSAALLLLLLRVDLRLLVRLRFRLRFQLRLPCGEIDRKGDQGQHQEDDRDDDQDHREGQHRCYRRRWGCVALDAALGRTLRGRARQRRLQAREQRVDRSRADRTLAVG